MLDLDVSVAWAIGLSLAVARAGALIALCAWVPRSMPRLARSALALSLGLLTAAPVTMPAASVTSDLVVTMFVNLTVGALVGWVLGLPLHLFSVAGTVIDTSSGITLGSVFDPETRTTPGPVAMLYSFTAQALVIAAGGLVVVTQVLWLSTRVIALDGRLGTIGGVSAEVVDSVSMLFRRGVELSLPITAVLFVGEIAFGLLSRMVPQINMFLVGLPAKTLLTVSMLGSAAVLFPRFTDEVIASGTAAALRLLGR